MWPPAPSAWPRPTLTSRPARSTWRSSIRAWAALAAPWRSRPAATTGWRPDNGLLGYALASLAAGGQLQGQWRDGCWPLGDDARAIALTEPRYWLPTVSRTFHGRDVFAPVAAHLARGVALDALGTRVTSVSALAMPDPEPLADGWRGVVLHVDRFGNLVTNLPAALLGSRDWGIELGGQQIAGLSPSYAAMPPLGAILGSAGYLEIAVPNGSAAEHLGVGVGAPVAIRPQ